MNIHLKILDFALSALWRRKLKNGVLLTVYASLVLMLSSGLFISESLKNEAVQTLQMAPELIIQKNIAGRHDLIPLTLIESIKEIPGVGEVTPRYWGYYYDPLSKSNYTIMAVAAQRQLPLLMGELPTNTGSCAIGEGVKLVRSVGEGSELVLVNSSNVGVLFEIKGVFQSDSNLLTNDLVLITIEDFVEFFGLPEGYATDLSVQVYNPKEVETVAAKIKTMFPETRPITKREILRTYEAVFNWRSGLFLALFVMAILSFLMLAWDRATSMSGSEKKEIGILKALGWDVANILELKFWEGFILSSTAFFIGIIGAYLHVFVCGGIFVVSIFKGWSMLFPSFQLVPFVSMYQIVVIAFFTMAPYIVSTLFPAWKAAVTDPETVMRKS